MSEERSGSHLPDRWKVSDRARGQRLDAYLAEVYETSRNQVSGWIRGGRVQVGDRVVKPSLRLEGGEWVSCDPLVISQEGVVEAEDGDLCVLFEDRHVIVLDKRADDVVHPGAGRASGTIANRLLARYPEVSEVGGPGRPGIVHRLDRGTSGVMVVARSAQAYTRLSADFAERRVGKTYLAIVYGVPKTPSGLIDAAIARHPQRRTQMTVSARGRPARSSYRTLASTRSASLLEIGLETGRTHQIRVHLKHIGHPLVGDPVYGEARWKDLPKTRQRPLREFPRPALHAWRLEFRHPESGTPLAFTAAPPADLAELWRVLSDSEISDVLGGDPAPRDT